MKDEVDKIGFGMAAIGRPLYINIRQDKNAEIDLDTFRQEGIRVLNVAYEQGIRYFDTAPGYGMAEEMLIDWVLEKDDASIEIATKWGYTYMANFDPSATHHEIKEHSLKKLNEQWAQSKALLPFLTNYQIHSATLETSVLDNQTILNRLAVLKDEHDLFIGITTTGPNQVDVLKKAINTEVKGKELFDVFQITYNVFDQSVASVAAEISKRNKRMVIKEALANGRVFPNDKYPHYAVAYQVLKQLAKKYGVGIDAIALRFCLDSIPLYKVLSGAATSQHLVHNLRTCDFHLDEEDMEALKKLAVSPGQYWFERKQLGWN